MTTMMMMMRMMRMRMMLLICRDRGWLPGRSDEWWIVVLPSLLLLLQLVVVLLLPPLMMLPLMMLLLMMLRRMRPLLPPFQPCERRNEARCFPPHRHGWSGNLREHCCCLRYVFGAGAVFASRKF
jgi:hypothetical protein